MNSSNITTTPTSQFQNFDGLCVEYSGRTFQIILLSIYVPVTVIGFVGSVTVFVTFAMSRKLRTVSNLFVIVLAFADINVTIFDGLMTTIHLWSEDRSNDPSLWCTLTANIKSVSISASILSVLLICLHRYIRLAKSKNAYVKSFGEAWKVCLWCVGPWASAMIIVVDPDLDYSCHISHSRHMAILVTYGITYVTVISLYLTAFRRIRKIQMQARRGGSEKKKSQFKTLQSSFISSGVNIHLYGPFVISSVWADNARRCDSLAYAVPIGLFQWLMLLCCCLNSIVYGALNTNFRRHFLALMRRKESFDALSGQAFSGGSMLSLRLSVLKKGRLSRVSLTMSASAHSSHLVQTKKVTESTRPTPLVLSHIQTGSEPPKLTLKKEQDQQIIVTKSVDSLFQIQPRPCPVADYQQHYRLSACSTDSTRISPIHSNFSFGMRSTSVDLFCDIDSKPSFRLHVPAIYNEDMAHEAEPHGMSPNTMSIRELASWRDVDDQLPRRNSEDLLMRIADNPRVSDNVDSCLDEETVNITKVVLQCISQTSSSDATPASSTGAAASGVGVETETLEKQQQEVPVDVSDLGNKEKQVSPEGASPPSAMRSNDTLTDPEMSTDNKASAAALPKKLSSVIAKLAAVRHIHRVWSGKARKRCAKCMTDGDAVSIASVPASSSLSGHSPQPMQPHQLPPENIDEIKQGAMNAADSIPSKDVSTKSEEKNDTESPRALVQDENGEVHLGGLERELLRAATLNA